MRKLLTFLLIACLSNGYAATLSEPQVVALKRELSEAAQALLDNRKAAGVAYAVVEDGQVRILEASGWADADLQRTLQTDTPLPLGSVSQLYAAALAMGLVEAGQLSLDDTVQKRLPALQLKARGPSILPITLRALLSHHSGLSAGDARGLYLETPAANSVLTRELILSRAPGVLTEESPQAIELAGALLSQTAGLSYAQLLDRHINKPLALRHTGLAPLPGAAVGHRKGDSEPVLYPRDLAALGVQASIGDFAKLLAALDPQQPGKWLSSASRSTLISAQNRHVRYDFENRQGMPWQLFTSRRAAVGEVATVSSRVPGFRTEVRMFPSHRLSVALVANWSEAGEELDQFIRQISDAALQAKAGIARRNPDEPLPQRIALPKGLVFDAPAAHYSSSMGLLRPQVDDDGFDFELGGFGLRAVRRADGWYALRYRLLGVIPLSLSFVKKVLIAPVRVGAQRLLVYHAGDSTGLFGSAFEPSAAPPQLQGLLGKYRISNPDPVSERWRISDIALVLDDGVPVLRASFDNLLDVDMTLPLRALGDNRYGVPGLVPGLGDSIRVLPGDPARILFSGYILERER